MRPNAVFWKLIVLLTILRGGESRDDNLLGSKTELLNASYVEMLGKSKKRKRVSELCPWSAQAREDEEGFPQSKRQACVDCDLGVWGEKVGVQRCIDTVVAHGCTDSLCSVCGSRHGLVVQGPSRGKHIPVNKLIGQKSSETQLQLLLLDSNVERVAIHGAKGIGKTTLMKHLHNYALNFDEMFDYVFWVTCPPHLCSIKDFQDYVAMAVQCDLSNIHDTAARAKKLFETLVSRGRTVIFLDAASEANLSLEDIGIPLSSEGSSCKLVITTSCPSASRLLKSFQIVQVNPLSEEEALALFMIEAGIDFGHISQLNDIPKLLSKKCRGVPRVIVETATRMCGIDDVREWRHRVNLGIRNDVLFEGSNDEYIALKNFS